MAVSRLVSLCEGGPIATCNRPAPEATHPSTKALQQLKELVESDPFFPSS